MTGKSGVVLVGYEGQENLGLRSIAAYLKQQGVRARIEPCQSIPREQILANLRADPPAVVGFSLIFQRMLSEFSGLISYLRENGVDAHFTIGGHFPTFEYQLLLETIPALDTVIRHEGELTLLELYGRLDQPERWSEIKGLAYRRGGKVVANPARPLIVDLDSLPFPVRNSEAVTHRGLGISSIAASRGCYYDCSFCSIHEFYREAAGPKRRSRSPVRVVDEIEWLFHERGTRVLIFQDDDMFMKGQHHRQWIDKFIRELHARDLAESILWRVSCRIDDLDAGPLRQMKAVGLASVYLGIESGSNQGLKTFNKRYTVQDVERALDLLKGIGLPFEYGFMILEPDSTLATVRDNIEFLSRVGADGGSLVNFCKMAPYAGTPIARRLAAEGRLVGTPDSPDYLFNDPRLDYLQLFLAETFNFRNFSDHGLVERLRLAKFDCAVLEKFFARDYQVDAYAGAVRDLISEANESAVRTVSLATRFIEQHSLGQILDYWPLLENCQEEEATAERRLGAALTEVQREFDFYAASMGVRTHQHLEPAPNRGGTTA